MLFTSVAVANPAVAYADDEVSAYADGLSSDVSIVFADVLGRYPDGLADMADLIGDDSGNVVVFTTVSAFSAKADTTIKFTDGKNRCLPDR